MRRAALHADQLVGEEHDGASWTGSSRRWASADARAAQRARFLEMRPWEHSHRTRKLSEREPLPFARAMFAELAGAVARFLPPVREPPPLRGVPFAFNLASRNAFAATAARKE